MFEAHKNKLILIAAGVVIVGAIFGLESRKATVGGSAGNQDIAVMEENERIEAKEGRFERAKEISTPTAFINTDEISVEEFVGEKIILVDFWTYSCINCQRTLPYLNAWHEKYADDGLVILGVHTPEFEFEEEFENVARAVEKYGIEYPVILDNDYSTWRSYNNRYWPRKYLIDIDGFVVYDHIGEGAYEETENKIVELLNERNIVLGEQAISRDTRGVKGIDEVDFSQVGSPEMYLGYDRVEYLHNDLLSSCLSRSCMYMAEVKEVPFNRFSLSGSWRIEKEYAALESSPGSIALNFSANKVNLVAGAVLGARAEIYLDGQLIVEELAGADVEGGIVHFSEKDLYNLVDLRGVYGNHMLEIRFLERGTESFAFTFG